MNHFGQAGRNGLIAAVFCFLLQGGWAVYANYRFGVEQSLLSGVVQGAVSCVMTFIVTIVIETMLARLSSWPPLTRFAASVAGTVGIMIATLTVIHGIAGTPDIWLTIALPVGMGSLYCTVYALGRIYRGKPRQGKHAVPVQEQ